jgi:hypothetical protein
MRGWLVLALVAGCSVAKPFDALDLGVTADLAAPDLLQPDLMACPSPCTTEGATQCQGNQIRTCQRAGDCLSWGPLSDCGSGQLCCATGCVALDELDCYGCNVTCSGTTPVCSSSLRRCACSAAACATQHNDCDDAVTGNCVPCVAPPVPETRSDFWVNAGATGSASGSLGCPYPTVTAALAAAGSSTAAQKTIHLLPGTYGAGETFPLIVRNGISIDGAATATTLIQGQGAWNGALAHSQADGTYQVTIVIGSDGGAANGLSNLTLQPSPTGAGALGVYCDRGNAPPIVNPVAPGFPSPNVTLRSLTLGPNYDFGVLATNSHPDGGNDTGCNLLVLASTFSDGKAGMWALGCGLNDPGTSSHTVAVQLGDNSAKNANTFTRLHNPGTTAFPSGSNNGAALHAWDCVSPIRVLDNVINDDDAAIALPMHSRDHVIDIENNLMTNLSNYGVLGTNNMQIDQFIGNTLSNIAEGASLPPPPWPFASHPALGLNTTSQMIHARGNVFSGNQVGLEIAGSGMSSTARAILDFGSDSDPGNNTFGCNSYSSASPGYDVYIHLTSASDSTPIQMAGNIWNHDAVAAAASGGDGTDLLVTSTVTPLPTVYTANQKPSISTCSGGRVP